MAELTMKSAFVESNTIGPRGASSWFILSVQVKASKEIRGLILVEAFEGLSRGIVALILSVVTVPAYQTGFGRRTLLG